MKLATLLLLVAVTSAIKINMEKDDTMDLVSGPNKVTKDSDEEELPPGNPRISAKAKE